MSIHAHPTDRRADSPPTSLLLAGLMLLTLVALVWRDAGLLPRVFWDEWVYSLNARHIPLSDAAFPSYLYHLVFRSTRLCGDGYLACARLLNATLFVAALPLVHGVAARYCSRGPALAATVATALAPVNAYTAYFMPEATYFFGFWLFTWMVLRSPQRPSAAWLARAGALLALLALVKVHAVFLLFPAAALLIGIAARDPGPSRVKTALRYLGWFTGAFLAVRLGLGYGFAGTLGLNILGSSYSQAAGAGLESGPLPILRVSAWILLLHGLALASMFALPIASMLRRLTTPAMPAAERDPGESLGLYSIALFATLVGVTTLFSALLVDGHASQSAGTLHMRYYNFALPLLFICAASDASLDRADGRAAGSWRWALGLSAFAAWGWWMLPAVARPVTVFSPELAGMMARPIAYTVLTATGIACALCWARDRRLGGRVFLGLQLPAMLLLIGHHVAQESRYASKPTVFDRAGTFARQNLGPADRSALQVIAPDGDPNDYGAVRTMMHIDDPAASFIKGPHANPFDIARITPGTAWLLVIGKRPLPPGYEPLVSANGFSLVTVPGTILLDFSRPLWPGLVNRTEGLGLPSVDGTLTAGDTLMIEFSTPLPKTFRLAIDATTIGLAADRRLQLIVGDRHYELKPDRLRPGSVIEVQTTKPARSVAIQGLMPAGVDKLPRPGLRIRSLRVTTHAKSASEPSEVPAPQTKTPA